MSRIPVDLWISETGRDHPFRKSSLVYHGEEGLGAKTKKRRKYSSYQGEISPPVPNVLKSDFHANKPNEKWLTDITEFSLPAGKVYLSPILDCFDGLVVCWTVGTSPDAALVNGMLDRQYPNWGKGSIPSFIRTVDAITADRAGSAGWIRQDWNGLCQRRGCSPDNSACEGLFGRLKNEMFYNRDWTVVSVREFIEILNKFLIWYNEERIKVSLGNISPREHRQRLGLAAYQSRKMSAPHSILYMIPCHKLISLFDNS